METSSVCVVTPQYQVWIPTPISSTQQRINQGDTRNLVELIGQEDSLCNQIAALKGLNCGFGKMNIQGTPEVDIMRFAKFNASIEDQFEYDRTIPLPPPNRRYTVKLNIKTIKKGKPTIVDPDWI